ncbi:MAG: FHA domain-containing protein [Planctomycetes bacterium]|nr:FHA domain-containing protein [Planctomycetota bacterium]
MQQMNNWHDRHSLARPNHLTKLPQVELEITRGRARNLVRAMRGTTFLIGSGSECDLVLGDPQFQDVHGYLLIGAQGLVIRHLGFDPELTVDGRPVRKALLWNQARIRTGPFEFRVHIRNAAADSELNRGGWDVVDGGAAAAELDAEGSPLRVFRGLDERRAPAGVASRFLEGRVNTAGRKPPLWRHISELLLSS